MFYAINSTLKSLLLIVLLILSGISAWAQRDEVTLSNGDRIVGELKSMDKGVVVIETPYSDSDFKIEWNGVKEIVTESSFLISTSKGARYTGTFRSDGDKEIIIETGDRGPVRVKIEDLVYINSIDDGFWSRVYANIDVGYSLAKANNQEQVNVGSRAGYQSDYWSVDFFYNSLLSKQDEVADIRRNDGGLGYRYFLPVDWYLSADLDFLSNTEQALDLRTNTKIGFGKYFIHTNKAYWGASIGAASNIEDFSQEADSTTQDRSSWEGFFGTEVNLYDIGDLNLFTSAIGYPSFTEEGRFRFDWRFDAKYDLLMDFYVKAGVTLNYDNKPAIEGRDTDYVFTTGFGWEW
mgnify:CR=1 FL=1